MRLFIVSWLSLHWIWLELLFLQCRCELPFSSKQHHPSKPWWHSAGHVHPTCDFQLLRLKYLRLKCLQFWFWYSINSSIFYYILYTQTIFCSWYKKCRIICTPVDQPKPPIVMSNEKIHYDSSGEISTKKQNIDLELTVYVPPLCREKVCLVIWHSL